MPKAVRLHDFLTSSQIRAAIRIWVHDRYHFHERVLDEVITPAMPDINRKLKQENDPRYIAYMIEFVFSTTF
jgi:hypothetical protein